MSKVWGAFGKGLVFFGGGRGALIIGILQY